MKQGYQVMMQHVRRLFRLYGGNEAKLRYEGHSQLNVYFVVMLVLYSLNARAEIYQWQDQKGRLHFTDSLVVYQRAISSLEQQTGQVIDVKSVVPQTVNIMTSPIKPKSGASLNLKSSSSSKVMNKAAQRIALKEQQQAMCDALRAEFKQLSETMKQGYGLDEAKHYKAKKLSLRQALWQKC
jgi:hypothetical protein